MAEEYEEDYTSSEATRRARPRRRRTSRRDGGGEGDNYGAPTLLTADFIGLAVQYANSLLFIGYEVNGLVEITVYPRYRFSSDDRVQGHLGYVRVPLGTPWEPILAQVDDVQDRAQTNYRTAITLRSNAMQAHGSRFESAYEAITDLFRESWHGFALRLRREGEVVKGNVTFTGNPPDPVLAVWRGEEYTLQVYPTGSITLVKGDQRKRLLDLSA
jgi:hypothetical protein